MAGLSLKHAFVSGLPDNATSSEVQPSNWNAEHAITLDQFNLIGRQSAGNGPAEEIPCTSVAMTLLAASTQLAMRAALGQSLTADIGLLQVTGAQIANATITAAQLAGITAQSMTVSALGKEAINFGLTASVASGNLTINLVSAAGATPSITDPVKIVFRDATGGLPTLGTPSLVTVNTATSLVIPSGATLGVTVNATPFRGWVVAINNGGTVVLGTIVCNFLDSTGLITSFGGVIRNEGMLLPTATAISTGADSGGVVYSSTGVSGKAFKILGYFEYSAGLASAGVYSIAPTGLSLFGPGDARPGDEVQRIVNTTNVQATVASGTLAPFSPVQTLVVTPTSLVNPIRLVLNGVCTCTSTPAVLKWARGTTVVGFQTQVLVNSGGVPACLTTYDTPGVLTATTYSVYGEGTSVALPIGTSACTIEATEIMA